MNTNNSLSFLVFFITAIVCLVACVVADDPVYENVTSNTTSNISVSDSDDLISNLTSDSLSGNSTSPDETLNTTENGTNPVQVYSGTEHPNEETDVKSSTPTGDPLLGSYAQGGVSIDIGASLMEGRGNSLNASSELTLKDHTGANGYIRTIQKDFRYMGSTDAEESI
jgi:hypothetical protein